MNTSDSFRDGSNPVTYFWGEEQFRAALASKLVGSLVRTHRGDRVHRPDCTTLEEGGLPRSRPIPWLWAVGRTEYEVTETIKFFGYEICTTCAPFTKETS